MYIFLSHDIGEHTIHVKDFRVPRSIFLHVTRLYCHVFGALISAARFQDKMLINLGSHFNGDLENFQSILRHTN